MSVCVCVHVLVAGFLICELLLPLFLSLAFYRGHLPLPSDHHWNYPTPIICASLGLHTSVIWITHLSHYQGYSLHSPASRVGCSPHSPAPQMGYSPHSPAPRVGYSPHSLTPQLGYWPRAVPVSSAVAVTY